MTGTLYGPRDLPLMGGTEACFLFGTNLAQTRDKPS